MAYLCLIPVLLFTGDRAFLINKFEVWAPDLVQDCIVVHHKSEYKQAYYFDCRGLNGGAIRFSLSGLNHA